LEKERSEKEAEAERLKEEELAEIESCSTFTNDHWIVLNDKLREVCICCFGKFSPADINVVNVIDSCMNELVADMREFEHVGGENSGKGEKVEYVGQASEAVRTPAGGGVNLQAPRNGHHMV